MKLPLDALVKHHSFGAGIVIKHIGHTFYSTSVEFDEHCSGLHDAKNINGEGRVRWFFDVSCLKGSSCESEECLIVLSDYIDKYEELFNAFKRID